MTLLILYIQTPPHMYGTNPIPMLHLPYILFEIFDIVLQIIKDSSQCSVVVETDNEEGESEFSFMYQWNDIKYSNEIVVAHLNVAEEYDNIKKKFELMNEYWNKLKAIDEDY